MHQTGIVIDGLKDGLSQELTSLPDLVGRQPQRQLQVNKTLVQVDRVLKFKPVSCFGLHEYNTTRIYLSCNLVKSTRGYGTYSTDLTALVYILTSRRGS